MHEGAPPELSRRRRARGGGGTTREKKHDADTGDETTAKLCEANEKEERTVDVEM